MNSNMNSNKNSNKNRKNFIVQIFRFLWDRKVYWIVPVIIFLILLIAVIIFGTSPVAPFVYTMV